MHSRFGRDHRQHDRHQTRVSSANWPGCSPGVCSQLDYVGYRRTRRRLAQRQRLCARFAGSNRPFGRDRSARDNELVLSQDLLGRLD